MSQQQILDAILHHKFLEIKADIQLPDDVVKRYGWWQYFRGALDVSKDFMPQGIRRDVEYMVELCEAGLVREAV